MRVFCLLVVLALACVLLSERGAAREITVDDDGEGAAFKTIQEAINNAKEGDEILIARGVYKESVILNRTLSLKGSGHEECVIVGVGDNHTLIVEASFCNISGLQFTGGWVGDAAGIYLMAHDIVIEDCRATQRIDGIRADSYLAETDNITIRNCIFDNNDNCGIDLGSSQDALVENCQCYSNHYGVILSYAHRSVVRNSSFLRNHFIGIDTHVCWELTLENNTLVDNDYANIRCKSSTRSLVITNNSCQGPTALGIDISKSRNLLIAENRISGCYNYGIRVKESDSGLLRNNHCSGNGDAGFFLHLSDNISFGNNSALKNQRGCYILDCRDIEIWGSWLMNNSKAGISLVGGELELDLEENVITGNTVGVLVEIESAGNITILDNIIAESSAFGINATLFRDGDILAQRNWWGEFTGPHHSQNNSLGKGDNVTDRVDFEPWETGEPNREPRAFILGPEPGMFLVGTSLNFRAAAFSTDKITNYRWVSSLDGELYNGSSPAFSNNSLSFGLHRIALQIRSEDGNWSKKDVLYLQILELPRLVMDPQLPEEALNTWDILFSARLVNNGTPLRYSWWSSIDGTLFDGRWSWFNHTGLSGGLHRINFRVQDPFGNWVDQLSQDINITQRPLVSITAPGPGPHPVGDKLIFNGTAVDDGEISRYAWWSSLAGELRNGSDGKKFETSNLTRGIHEITFLAQDDEGLWSPPTIATVVVTDYPGCKIDKISPDPAGTLDTIHFSASAWDDGEVVSYHWWTEEGELYHGPNASFSVKGLDSGLYNAYLQVQDEMGYLSQSVFKKVFRVQTSPTAQIIGITPETSTEAKEWVTFRALGSDSNQVVRYFWRSSLDGVLYNGSQNIIQLNNLSFGEHEIFLRVMDEYGAWSLEVNSDFMKVALPTAHIDFVEPQQLTMGQTVALRGHGEGDDPIAAYEWKLNQTGASLGTQTEIEIADLGPGKYTVAFRVKSTQELWSHWVAVDLQVYERPVASAQYLSSGAVLLNQSFRVQARNTNGELARAVWVMDGKEIYNGTEENLTIDHRPVGTYTLKLRVQGPLGKWSRNSYPIEFVVHTRPTAQIVEIEKLDRNNYPFDGYRFVGAGLDDGSIKRYVWRSSHDGEFYNGSDTEKSSFYFSKEVHIFYLRVMDNHGVWSEEVNGTTKTHNGGNGGNTPKPTIALSQPKPGEVVSGDTFVITGSTYNSDEANLYSISMQRFETQISIDGGAWKLVKLEGIFLSPYKWTYTLNTKYMKMGNHTIRVKAYDGFYHSDVTNVTFVLGEEDTSTQEEALSWEIGYHCGYLSFLIFMIYIYSGMKDSWKATRKMPEIGWKNLPGFIFSKNFVVMLVLGAMMVGGMYEFLLLKLERGDTLGFLMAFLMIVEQFLCFGLLILYIPILLSSKKDRPTPSATKPLDAPLQPLPQGQNWKTQQRFQKEHERIAWAKKAKLQRQELVEKQRRREENQRQQKAAVKFRDLSFTLRKYGLLRAWSMGGLKKLVKKKMGIPLTEFTQDINESMIFLLLAHTEDGFRVDWKFSGDQVLEGAAACLKQYGVKLEQDLMAPVKVVDPVKDTRKIGFNLHRARHEIVFTTPTDIVRELNSLLKPNKLVFLELDTNVATDSYGFLLLRVEQLQGFLSSQVLPFRPISRNEQALSRHQVEERPARPENVEHSPTPPGPGPGLAELHQAFFDELLKGIQGLGLLKGWSSSHFGERFLDIYGRPFERENVLEDPDKLRRSLEHLLAKESDQGFVTTKEAGCLETLAGATRCLRHHGLTVTGEEQERGDREPAVFQQKNQMKEARIRIMGEEHECLFSGPEDIVRKLNDVLARRGLSFLVSQGEKDTLLFLLVRDEQLYRILDDGSLSFRKTKEVSH